MRLHRISKGCYAITINGTFYTIVHGIHWCIYGGDNMDHLASAHTLTDARALLEEIIKGDLPI